MTEDRIAELEKENQDLRMLLATATEHGDTVEALLHAEIEERKRAQATLESILRAVQRSKADLEIMLETMIEHGETVTQYELCNQAVEWMRQSEEQFRAIAEATPVAMIISQPETGIISYANTEGINLFGKDLIGKNVQDLIILESDRAHLQAQLESAGKLTNYELQMYSADGLPFWVLASVHMLFLQGRTVVLHTFFDITERKRMESRLQQSGAFLREQAQFLEVIVEARTMELQAAEAKYRSIFENAVEGIYQINPEGQFLVVNPALARIYKYNSPADLIRSVQDVATQIYVNAERYREFIHLLQTRSQVENFESEVYCKDGSIIWVSENGHAVRNEQGQVIYYEGMVQDITARRQAEIQLRLEQANSERLLLNIFPKTIAERLKQNQNAMIAENYPEVSILFADIVEFTSIASQMPPQEVVTLLNGIFSHFDNLAESLNLEKIKTIGDEYMVVGGLPDPNPNHASAIAEMALAMQRAIKQFQTPWGTPLSLRIGINTGSVIAGVIGQKKFSYDLWGDAVNLASRMESQGEPHKIQVSEMTYVRLREDFHLVRRGLIPIRGKGEMCTYWLLGKKTK
ncbi:MAG: adenylate/guanylate cyclase domain-containing protein [Pseudanabaenaceae cyanobacterium]